MLQGRSSGIRYRNQSTVKAWETLGSISSQVWNPVVILLPTKSVAWNSSSQNGWESSLLIFECLTTTICLNEGGVVKILCGSTFWHFYVCYVGVPSFFALFNVLSTVEVRLQTTDSNVSIFLFSLIQTDPVQGLIHYLQNYGHKERKLKKVRKTMVRLLILFSGSVVCFKKCDRGRAVIQI